MVMKLLLGLSLLWNACQAEDGPPALRGAAADLLAPSFETSNDPLANLPYLLDRQGRRHLEVGGMKPQSCNDRYSPCVRWSNFIGTANVHTNTVTIPCGRCVTMDHSGSTLTLNGGLDIQGKLVFPSSYSGLTLSSTLIVVQGELVMSSTGSVGDNPAVKFLMIGNSVRSFEPIGDNAGYCGGRLCTAGKKAIIVAGGHVDIQGVHGSTKTWTKLYDVVGNGQTTDAIVLPADGVLNRWGVGAEVLITSYTNKGNDQQVRFIERMDTDYARDGFVRLFLDSAIDRPTTTRDSSDFAVEVALLSRNIVFEGGPDNVAFHGGHFWIFETQGYNQRVEGVELVNFGQAGELGRYPLHAHLCGDLNGSKFSKNTIRESNQRCIVVHATDNLLIEDNVAFDTGGHCFMLEDGMETGNQFIGNLGALTRRPGRIIPNHGTNGKETDAEATTFWIPALGNTFVNNVAAGSAANGWWFEPMMRGPLAENYPGWRPELVNLERFEGNEAHSNGIGMKTYPRKGLRPEASRPNRFVDFKAYRNQFRGLFVFFAHNLIIDGGVFADNSINLDVDQSLNVQLFDVLIVGESDIYKQQIAAQRLRQPCLSNRVIGLQLNTDGGRTGVTVASASFEGFSNTRCGSEFPARLDNKALSINSIPGIGEGGQPNPGGGGGGGPGGGGGGGPGGGGGGGAGGGGGGGHSLGDLPDGLYINCGGEEKRGGGVTWEADKYYDNGEEVRLRPSKPSLYNQYREQEGGSLDYTIPVNDGNYKVTLFWSEYKFKKNNLREFAVYLNGQLVEEDMDVHAVAGGRRKLTKRAYIANVRNDEELQISIVGSIDKGFLSLLGVEADRGN